MNFFKKQNKKEPQNLKDAVGYLKKLEKDVKRIGQELEDVKKISEAALQKVGVVRFSPFKEVGSDQSFSIALLDAGNNGIVLTSYYSRDLNRVYTKPIENGSSKYSLAEEEKKAIEEAINNNLKL